MSSLHHHSCRARVHEIGRPVISVKCPTRRPLWKRYIVHIILQIPIQMFWFEFIFTLYCIGWSCVLLRPIQRCSQIHIQQGQTKLSDPLHPPCPRLANDWLMIKTYLICLNDTAKSPPNRRDGRYLRTVVSSLWTASEGLAMDLYKTALLLGPLLCTGKTHHMEILVAFPS